MVFYKFLNRNFKNTNYFCNSNEELLYVRYYVCCNMAAGVGQFPFASFVAGVSTLHDINVFRCDVAEFSDNLAGDKRPIVLNISAL